MPDAHVTHSTTRRQRWGKAGAVAGITVLLTFAACEVAGWPFLADPVQSLLTRSLHREVQISAATDASLPRFRLHLLGHPRLSVGALQVANPPWSEMGSFVDAQGIVLHTTWSALWQAGRGGPIALRQVSAKELAVKAERRDDGSASWKFDSANSDGAKRSPSGSAKSRTLMLDRLNVDDGRFEWNDAPLQVQATGTLRTPSDAHPSAAGREDSQPLAWELQAQGTYRGSPMTLQVQAGKPGADALNTATMASVPLAIRLRAQGLKLDADGQIVDPLDKRQVQLNFDMSGPSLAEAGAPMGVNLPTTPAFRLKGALGNDGSAWVANVADARIGKSELSGEFRFVPSGSNKDATVARLTGSLKGSRLLLQDLGPTIGSTSSDATVDKTLASDAARRVLPDRRLDLPSLERMDADVSIALAQVDLGRPQLRDIRQLQAHLTVNDGVLSIRDMQARLAQGDLSGSLQVDGRRQPAHWHAEVQAREVKLDQWIEQTRTDGQPPYASGRIALGLSLQGQGNSTAAVLADADGRLWSVWSDGMISHLMVEAAGLDIAQALGVYIKGDDALPVTCGALDTTISKGVAIPRVLLVDTPDSTLWGIGSVSLADERTSLELRSRPKDFSLLSLRSPIQVEGSLGAPQLSLDSAALLTKAVPAALLASINPLAALLPLVDTGEDKTNSRTLQRCRAVVNGHAPKG